MTLYDLVRGTRRHGPLARYLLDIGDDELKVLSYIAGRLELGRKKYGALDVNAPKRDWGVELGEEAADALVYAAAKALRKKPDPLADAIDDWHNGAGLGVPLYAYLGWTAEEYASWVRDPSAGPGWPPPHGNRCHSRCAIEPETWVTHCAALAEIERQMGIVAVERAMR